MTKGFVYFVACKDPNYRIANPHMKIGHTTNLEGRLSSIQTGSPVALMFIVKHQGDPLLSRGGRNWVHFPSKHLSYMNTYTTSR